MRKIDHGLPRYCSSNESACQCRRCRWHGFDSWVRKIPWSRKWQRTPAFFPRESHGKRSLASCSPWNRKVSDTTEWLRLSFFLSLCIVFSRSVHVVACVGILFLFRAEWHSIMCVYHNVLIHWWLHVTLQDNLSRPWLVFWYTLPLTWSSRVLKHPMFAVPLLSAFTLFPQPAFAQTSPLA